MVRGCFTSQLGIYLLEYMSTTISWEPLAAGVRPEYTRSLLPLNHQPGQPHFIVVPGATLGVSSRTVRFIVGRCHIYSLRLNDPFWMRNTRYQRQARNLK